MIPFNCFHLKTFLYKLIDSLILESAVFDALKTNNVVKIATWASMPPKRTNRSICRFGLPLIEVLNLFDHNIQQFPPPPPPQWAILLSFMKKISLT